MTLILDAGALLALERDDRAAWRHYESARLSDSFPVSHGGIIGQVWRGGGPSQARFALALKGLKVWPLDEALGRKAGALLAKTRTKDVIDAALVLLAEDGDEIMTSDPGDISVLAGHADLDIDIIPM
jgi:hypothetical protein